MNQEERLNYLLNELCQESKQYQTILPRPEEKRRVLRSLMNVRPPAEIGKQYLEIQNEFLQQEAKEKGIVSLADIPTIKEQFGSHKFSADRMSLWQGDITRLQVDAIVNAANSQMLGCFVPCHGCIDNAIHSAAGVQLREECHQRMENQGYAEPTGQAKITKGYNLPARHVLHTVGPIVSGRLTKEDIQLLKSCYESCLTLAEQHGIKTIALCCISTGEFHFPGQQAAEIAVDTVQQYLMHSENLDRIIFNVFKDQDYKIYQELLV